MSYDVAANTDAALFIDIFMRVHIADCTMVLNVGTGRKEFFCLCGEWTTIMQPIDRADTETLCLVCIQYGAYDYVHGTENA